MTANWGIRYIVVGVGSREDQATEEDVTALTERLNEMMPLQFTAISPRVSDKLTLALLQERGAL